jgi:hypothetical protein
LENQYKESNMEAREISLTIKELSEESKKELRRKIQ